MCVIYSLGVDSTDFRRPQSFEENSTLEGILAELIIPAVKRKELALRAQGLISLGLCCLIAKVYIIYHAIFMSIT